MVIGAHFDFPATPPLPTSMQSLLVFGGSFDPPHRAHLALAEIAARATNSSRILLIPANRSPHKMAQSHSASAADRLKMVELAIAREPMFSVSPIELDRPPPSFTVDTLQALRTSLGPDVVIRWLIGSDQSLSFERWYQWEKILELAEPAVLLRPPHNNWQTLVASGLNEHIFKKSILIEAPLDPVSSTKIRGLIAKRMTVADFPAPEVLNYITERRLYLLD